MRARARELRRIASLAHDQTMIAMLLRLADEGEADADQMEEGLRAGSAKA